MSLLTTNFVKKVIFSPVGTGDLTVVLADVIGLPNVSAPEDFTILTMFRLVDNQYEIMKVTDIDGGTNTLTVERAQEGTLALTFVGNDQCRNLFTAGMFDQFTFEADTAVAAEAQAIASAAEALASEQAAAADLVLTNADVVLTGLDVDATNADVVLTNADVVSTNADVVLTNADVVTTGLDVTAASDSAAKANAWADEDEDVPVEMGPDQFSAFHWAQKSLGGVTPQATEVSIGGGELSTQAEAEAGADDLTIMTPLKVKQSIDANVPDVPDATESVKGIAELATQAEAEAGIDNVAIMTSLRVKQAISEVQPSRVVAFAYAENMNTSPVIRHSIGVTSITRTATGKYTVTFAGGTHADADYGVHVSIGNVTALECIPMTISDIRTATEIKIESTDAANNARDAKSLTITTYEV